MSEKDIIDLLKADLEHLDPQKVDFASAKINNILYTSKQKEAVNTIIKKILNQASDKLRAAMSRSIAENPYLDKVLAKGFALDIEEISAPFLSITPVLTDEDLIEILDDLSEEGLVAVASRPTVGSFLSSCLINKGCNKAAKRLIDNNGAKLSTTCLEDAMRLYSNDEEFLRTVLSRSDIVASITIKAIKHMAYLSSEEIWKKSPLDAEPSRKIARDAEYAVITEILENSDQKKQIQLLEVYKKSNDLSSLYLLYLSNNNKRTLLKMALLTILGVNPKNIPKYVKDEPAVRFHQIVSKLEIQSHIKDNIISSII